MAPRIIPIGSSTNIKSVAYDDDTGDMIIVFQRKELTYKYRQIPIQIAEGFSQSESPGKYFRGSILNQFTAEPLGPAQ